VYQVTGQDGTPSNFIILATADLTNWTGDPNAPNSGQPGWATMGIYQNNGTVFTAATTNWSRGLSQGNTWNPVDQITLNILRELSRRFPLDQGFSWWEATLRLLEEARRIFRAVFRL